MDIKELQSFRLSDAVKFHDKLNPKLWRGNRLDPKIKKQLMTIAEDFVTFMGISNLDIEDITISGSNAAFSYTPHSDIDLHILVDFSKLPEDEVYQELFGAKKTLYNEKHDITVNGVPVELYVQDTNQEHTSLGEYSLLKDKWIKIPKKRRANFDERATKAKYEKLGELVELALRSKDLEKVTGVLDIIKRYRRAGLSKAGEFGPENLAFKAIRSQGLIQKLFDLKAMLHTKKLSTENMYEQTDKDHLKKLAQAAQAQRGEPEIAMTQAQRALGGGVLTFVIEHVGDIYNRMHNTGYGELDDYNSNEERRYVVLDKIEKTLRTLTRKYGFEREHKENLESNARFFQEHQKLPPEEYMKRVDAALKRYALAHSKLPVYNRPQELARAASIALGEGDYSKAANRLFALRDIAENEKLWHEEINKFSENLKESDLDEATRRGFLQGLGALGASALGSNAEAGKYVDNITRVIDRERGWEFWEKEKAKLKQRVDPILDKLITLANERRKKSNKPLINKPYIVVGNQEALATINGDIESSAIHLDVTVFYDLSDDALAATLAHEIGHLALNHPSYGKNIEANRNFEIQADVYGIQLMMAAGYDPRDAMKSLEDQGLDYAETPTKTHPAVSVRKKRVNEALKKQIFHLISAIKNYKSNVQYLASLRQQGDTRVAETTRKGMKKEDWHPNEEPPGPEFRPTMPKGTVRVDVSDLYDWDKIGRHISNLKGLGKHDFGKGPPSTIISFGDEETEHKYIKDLEKTGLTTTDIDPPGGKKRQKTDPTYNVNEMSGNLFTDNKPKLIGLSFSELERLSESAGADYNKFNKTVSENLNLPRYKGSASNTLNLYSVYRKQKIYESTDKKLSDTEKKLFSIFNSRVASSIDSAKPGDIVSLLMLTTLSIPNDKTFVNLQGFLNPKQIESITRVNGIDYLHFADGTKFPETDNNDPMYLAQSWAMTKLFNSYDSASKAYLLYVLEGEKLSDEIQFNINVDIKQDITEASGYIPSEKEKNDPRFKTALTKDVRPDAIQKNAKAFGWKVDRSGRPPLLR